MPPVSRGRILNLQMSKKPLFETKDDKCMVNEGTYFYWFLHPILVKIVGQKIS